MSTNAIKLLNIKWVNDMHNAKHNASAEMLCTKEVLKVATRCMVIKHLAAKLIGEGC